MRNQNLSEKVDLKRGSYQTYDQRKEIHDIHEKKEIHDIQEKSLGNSSHRGTRTKIINGNQVIRVNASDPTSIINSGRKEINESSPISGYNNLQTYQSKGNPASQERRITESDILIIEG